MIKKISFKEWLKVLTLVSMVSILLTALNPFTHDYFLSFCMIFVMFGGPAIPFHIYATKRNKIKLEHYTNAGAISGAAIGMAYPILSPFISDDSTSPIMGILAFGLGGILLGVLCSSIFWQVIIFKREAKTPQNEELKKRNFDTKASPIKKEKQPLTWYNEKGELHREGGPAFLIPNKIEKWYKNGKLHREDGPAKTTHILGNMPPHHNFYWGTQKWFIEGLLHREDAPSVVSEGGLKKWFNHGLLHREDGPAVEYPDGGKEYWVNGNLHREDGPAIKTLEIEAWFKHGKLDRHDGPAYSRHIERFPTSYGNAYRVSKIIEKFCSILPVAKSGEQQWWKSGVIHRDDGPAVLYADGTQKWYQKGKIHRDGAPAVLYPNGSKEWWHHGRLHRKNGPAVEVSEGYFIFSQGTKNIRSYSWQNPQDKQFLLRRMEAIELPISEIDKTETRKPYVNREDTITYRVYQDKGECRTENEHWIRGKKIEKADKI